MLGAVRAPEAGRARAEERVLGAAPVRVVVPAVGAGPARAGWGVGESAAKQSFAFAKCSLVVLVAAHLESIAPAAPTTNTNLCAACSTS
jgi:hypothetical protein